MRFSAYRFWILQVAPVSHTRLPFCSAFSFSAAAFCLCRILFSSAVASSFGLSSRMSPAEWLRGFLNTTFFSSLLLFPVSPELDVPLEVSTIALGLRSLIFTHSTGALSAPGEVIPVPTSTLGFLLNVFCKSKGSSFLKYSLSSYWTRWYPDRKRPVFFWVSLN